MKEVANNIVDADDIQSQFKTKAELAKLDYQKFVEDEFGKIEK